VQKSDKNFILTLAGVPLFAPGGLGFEPLNQQVGDTGQNFIPELFLLIFRRRIRYVCLFINDSRRDNKRGLPSIAFTGKIGLFPFFPC